MSKHINVGNWLLDAAQRIGYVEHETVVAKTIAIEWPAFLRVDAAVSIIVFSDIFWTRAPSHRSSTVVCVVQLCKKDLMQETTKSERGTKQRKRKKVRKDRHRQGHTTQTQKHNTNKG